MKKIILIISIFAFTFTACNLEDKLENIFDSSIPSVQQEISENFTIEAIRLPGPGKLSKTRTIDVTEIREKIDETSDGLVNIENITFEDLEINLTEGSDQANFDFLDTLTLTVSSSDDNDPLFIDFGTIEKGATSLTLPESVNTSILDLINETESNELTIDLDLVTNAAVEGDLELELISTLLADLGIGL